MIFKKEQLEEIAKELRDLQKKIPTLDMTIHDRESKCTTDFSLKLTINFRNNLLGGRKINGRRCR